MENPERKPTTQVARPAVQVLILPLDADRASFYVDCAYDTGWSVPPLDIFTRLWAVELDFISNLIVLLLPCWQCTCLKHTICAGFGSSFDDVAHNNLPQTSAVTEKTWATASLIDVSSYVNVGENVGHMAVKPVIRSGIVDANQRIECENSFSKTLFEWNVVSVLSLKLRIDFVKTITQQGRASIDESQVSARWANPQLDAMP